MRQVRSADADAGIADRPGDSRVLIRRLGEYTDIDGAAVGIFKRVAEQVLQDFLQSGGVRADRRQVVRDVEVELELLFARQRLERKLEVVGDIADRKLFDV